MKVYAIADLHLAISTPSKTMEVFGDSWKDYQPRIKDHWQSLVTTKDLVLIPGDITWALHLEEAAIDLKWIDELPGQKVILKGNHDYWWPSNKKLSELLPPSIQFVNNNALKIGDLAIGGSRLWDDPDFTCEDIVEFIPSPLVKPKKIDPEHEKQIFEKELIKLENSLKQLDKTAPIRICLTHYPPLPNNLKESRASKIIEDYNCQYCIFGHLHNVKSKDKIFGKREKTDYIFVAADYLKFVPKLILET